MTVDRVNKNETGRYRPTDTTAATIRSNADKTSVVKKTTPSADSSAFGAINKDRQAIKSRTAKKSGSKNYSSEFNWGNTKGTFRTFGDTDEDMQQKIDNLEIAYDDPDRSFHYYAPDANADQSYLDQAMTINKQRSIYELNNYWDNRNSGLNNYDTSFQWMQDAQIYYQWAKDNDFKVVGDDGTEYDMADLWKAVYDNASFDTNYGYYITGDASYRDLDTTLEKLNGAEQMLAAATTPEDKELWTDVVGALKTLRSQDNRAAKSKLDAVVEANNQQRLQLENDKRSAWDGVEGYDAGSAEFQKASQTEKDAKAKIKTIDDENESLKTQIKALNDSYVQWSAPQEVLDAIDRLGRKDRSRVYGDLMRQMNADVTDPKQIVSTDMLVERDKELVDAFYTGEQLEWEFNNYRDDILAFGESKTRQWMAAGANTISMIERLTGEYLFPELEGSGITTVRNPELIDSLSKKYTEAMKAYRKSGSSKDLRKAESLYAQIEALQKDRVELDYSRPEVIEKMITNGKNLNKWALNNYNESQELMNQIKNGMGKYGKFAVDATSSLMDIGLDTVSGLGLWGMAARVFGTSAMDYQNMGADTLHQALGGALSTVVEVLSEKIGGTLGFAYGKGYTDDALEYVIESLAKNPAGMNGLRLLAGAVSEGGEEVVSDIFQPLIDWVADKAGRGEWSYKLEPKEVLRDFLLGATAGMFGDVVNAASGDYAAKNAKIAAEDIQVIKDYLSSDEELAPAKVARLERAEGRVFPKGAVVIDKNGAARVVGGKKGKAGDLRTDVFIPNSDREGVGLATHERAGDDAHIKPAQEEAPPARGTVSAFEANGVSEAAQQVATKNNSQQANAPTAPVDTTQPLVRTDPKGWAAQQAEKISDDFNAQEKRAVTRAINTLADIQIDGDAAMQQTIAQAKENVATMLATQGIAAGTTLSSRDIEGFLNDEIQRISSTATETAQGAQQVSAQATTPEGRNAAVKPATESTGAGAQPSAQSVAAQNNNVTADPDANPLEWTAQQVARIPADFTPEERRATARAIKAISEIHIGDTAETRALANQAKANLVDSLIEFGVDPDTPSSFFGVDATRNSIIMEMDRIATENNQTTQQQSGTAAPEVSQAASKYSPEVLNQAQALINKYNADMEALHSEASYSDYQEKQIRDELWDGLKSLNVLNDYFSGELGVALQSAQHSGTIEQSTLKLEQSLFDKGEPENGNLGGEISANAGNPQTENSEGKGRNTASRPVSFPAGDISGEGIYRAHKEIASEYENAGGRIVPREEMTSEELEVESFLQKLGVKHLTVVDSQGKIMPDDGRTSRGWPGVGVFVVRKASNTKAFRQTAVHEALHNVISQKLLSQTDAVNRSEILTRIYNKAKITDSSYEDTFWDFALIYAENYINAPNGFHTWADPIIGTPLGYQKQVRWFQNRSAEDLVAFSNLVQEEILCNLVAGTRGGLFDGSFDDLVRYARDEIAEVFFNTNAEDISNFINNDDAALQDKQIAYPPGKTKGQGSHLPGQTQTRSALNNEKQRAQYIAEKYGVGDGTYQSYTRKQISEMADACIEEFGAENEVDRLINKKNWDRVDFSEAGKLVLEMTMKLNADMVDGRKGLGHILEKEAGESWEDFKQRQAEEDERAYQERREPIDALLQAYKDEKTTAAQNLQEKYNFSTADELRMRASQRFLNYTENGMVHAANDRQVNARMYRIVDDLIQRAEAADDSQNVKSIVDNIKLVNRIRGREAMFGKAGQAVENWMLNRMVKNGVDAGALTAMMYGSINKIMDDLTPMSYAEMIESVRVTNMLSNVATGLNNLLNNAVALRTGALAQNAAVPFAKAFENVTGKKVAVGDKSLLRTKPIRRAEEVALEYAILSSYYGMNGDEGRIDIKHGDSGFNVHGGWLERALARYNFFVQSLVLNPDAPAKVRAEMGIQQGIDKAFEGADLDNPEVYRNKKELEGYAHKEAQRRVLQDENAFTRAVMYVRDQFLGKAKTPGENKMIGNRRLGSFDLGRFMLAFAKVPTNVGIQKVAATPYGALYHTAKYAYTLAKAKADPDNITVNEMAKASRDIGRAATTTGMIALGALAAMTGALKNFDDNDDEEEKKLAAEKGYKGLTLNLSALFRPGDEWRDDDTVLSGNFLEILATPLAIGAAIYDARKEGLSRIDAVKHGTVEAFTGMMDAVMEIPGLQQIGDLYQSFAYRNPDEDDFTGAAKSIGEFAVNSGMSYIMPNIVSQANAGIDNTMRDVYKTDSYPERLMNIMKNKTPVLRQTLPEKTDTFGNARTYGDSKLMGFINTVLLPGDIKKYHVNELEQELFRLNAAGYKSTWFDTTGPKTIDVDGETYALDANQQRAYHETKSKYLVEAYDAFRTSDVYKNLTDEERASVYKQLRLDADRQTKQECLKAEGVDANVTMAKWETELKTWEDKVNYLTAKSVGEELWDNEDYQITNYADMDAYMKKYGKLSDTQRELLDGSLSQFDDIYDASQHGIGSEMWQKAYDIYRDYNSEEGKARVEGGYKGWEATQMWTDIQKATGASEDQMAWFEENMKLYNHIPADYEKYHTLVDSGWSRDQAQALAVSISQLEPADGNTTVSYKQRLTAIAKLAGVDDSLRWDAFFEYCPKSYTSVIRKMSSLRAAGKTYKEALTAAGKWMD